jgi:hypothetical protein
MNPHYTGYELELNQSRQASIRSEFEHEALTKSLNEDDPVEGPSRPQAQSRSHSRVKKAFFISLLGAVLVLAYFILVPFSHASAHFNNVASPGSNKAGVLNLNNTTSLVANNPSLAGNYTVRVGVKDIPALLRFEEPGVNKYLGNWFVSLDDQGTYTASLNDQVLLQGQFEAAVGQITFTSGEGTPLCANDQAEMTGTYTDYPVEQGFGLFFLSDNCYPRSLVLSTHALKQVIPVQDPPRGE